MKKIKVSFNLISSLSTGWRKVQKPKQKIFNVLVDLTGPMPHRTIKIVETYQNNPKRMHHLNSQILYYRLLFEFGCLDQCPLVMQCRSNYSHYNLAGRPCTLNLYRQVYSRLPWLESTTSSTNLKLWSTSWNTQHNVHVFYYTRSHNQPTFISFHGFANEKKTYSLF